MRMSHYHELHKFAVEYLALYQDINTPYYMIEEGFADRCFDLNLKMDCGESFCRLYPEGMRDADNLKKIIHNVTNPEILGSAIFSQWRYVTHWAMSPMVNLMDENYRPWFVEAFTRLAELTDVTNTN